MLTFFFFILRKNANAAMLSNYEVRSYFLTFFFIFCGQFKEELIRPMTLLFTCVFLRCSNSSQTWRSRERTAGSTNTAPGSRTSTPSCMRSENILCVSRACHVYPFSKAQPQFGLYFHQTLKYLSKTPCSRQSPEIVKEFLTTMVPHKLTKSVRSGHHTNFQPWCFQ